MSRFSKLELGAEEDFGDLVPRRVVKDEKFYVGLARERFEEGNFENALRFYSRALEFDSRIAEAWLGQVQSLLELGEAHEASVWADKALENFKDHAEILAAKSVAALRLGDAAKAVALSDMAFAQKGASAYRWRGRGEVFLRKGPTNAEYCFGKALGAAPGDWFEPLMIGRVYLHHRKPTPAYRYLQLSVDRNASSPFAWENMGLSLEGQGRSDRAKAAYRSALDLDPGRSLATNRLTSLESESTLSCLWRRAFSWWRG